MEATEQEAVLFDDVAVYFTLEEWRSLEEWQKELYKEVMVENYHTLCSLGFPVVKSELLLLIEGGEEPCVPGQLRWEELRCEPGAAPGGRSWMEAEDRSARTWQERQSLTFSRRVVRKRCGRRSPNFSRVELECFVSLMDRYLPDELQRTGAISLRQRRSILQQIARCLEPMSGCLRTPRQLLHRWADFYNRDPERLMEIRMQLLYANHEQSWEPSSIQTAPPAGKRWRRSTPHPPSSSSEEEEEEGEESAGDSLYMGWEEGLSDSSPHYLPDPSPQTSLTAHIDAQGRYIVPTPPLPESGGRWWYRCAGEQVEEPSDLIGSPTLVDRSPERVPSAGLYSSLQEGGLRRVKSEPDSEEDEGGGSWSSDVPSPGSILSGHQRREIKMEEAKQQSLSLVSSEESSLQVEPPAGGSRAAIKRSPNFSPAELECFVALMDHFLPDNLIRAGALPIRRRKAILQEIARRLEPLSGCLRTPRQLRHRWTDFNNRDPDRLEEIRRRLRRAARKESSKLPGKAVELAPMAGNQWRHRRSHLPLRQDMKEEVQTPEQMRPDPSEDHRPRTPWHHHELPKRRNSFSTSRLKKNPHRALHIFRMERLRRRVDQQQERLLESADLSARQDDCNEVEISI